MEKMLIMVPCYNCQRQAPRVAQAIDHFLNQQSPDSPFQIDKVLFVDNHSTDATVESAQRAFQNLRHANLFSVAQNQKNYGLGGSHKSVFSYALQNNYDVVAVVHGDNQANAEELSRLLELAAKNPNSSILGSRFSTDSQTINYSPTRIWGNVVLNHIYSWLLGQKVFDLGSGLNVFRIKSLKNREFLHFDDHFTFNMDLLIYLISHQHPVLFAPISWKTEDEVSNALSWKVGSRALAKIISWKFLKSKIWNSPPTQGSYAFSILHNG